MPRTRRSSGAPGAGLVLVNAAISPKVRPAGRLKNRGSLMPPAWFAGSHLGLEFGPAAKHEGLGDVEALFGEGNRVVDAKRTKWRIPDQSDADRGTRLGSISGPGVGAGTRRREVRLIAERVGKDRRLEHGGAAVIPHVTDVSK